MLIVAPQSYPVCRSSSSTGQLLRALATLLTVDMRRAPRMFTSGSRKMSASVKAYLQTSIYTGSLRI